MRVLSAILSTVCAWTLLSPIDALVHADMRSGPSEVGDSELNAAHSSPWSMPPPSNQSELPAPKVMLPHQFRLANHFSSDMVLQMEPKRAQIWGYGQPFAEVVLTFNDSAYVTTVDRDGTWSVRLPPTPAGGPHLISIEHIPASLSKATTEDLSGVMFGDVWVCSGGSNMAQELHSVLGWQEAVERAKKQPNLRLFQARRLAVAQELGEGGVVREWRATTEDVLLSYFPALCLLYGLELASLLPTRPIGLIEAAWGGTPIQAWASTRVIKSCQNVQGRTVETPRPTSAPRVPAFKSHAGEHSRIGHVMVIPPLVTSHHGSPHHIATHHVMPPHFGPQPPHHPTVMHPNQVHHPHHPQHVPHVEPPHAAGHVVSHVFVTVRPEDQEGHEHHHQIVEHRTDQYSDSALWNGMIHPLTNFAIRGIIWHQGSSSTAYRSEEHSCVFNKMIRDWQQSFLDSDIPVPTEQSTHVPFGYVQLGPSRSSRSAAWGNLRLQQTAASPLFNLMGNFQFETFMATSYDLIDAPDTEVTGLGAHYRDKTTVAKRLALAAQQLMYDPTVDATGPSVLLDEIVVDEAKLFINVTFDKDIQVRGPEGFFFEMKSDNEWIPGEIKSSTLRSVSLVLPSGAVQVAYGWGALPCEHARCAIYSSDPLGFPALPFKAFVPL